MRRSTSTSHHSRPLPPGRSAPRTSVPARSSADQLALGDGRLEVVALGERLRRERPAPAREARDQRAQRVGHGLEEGRGHAAGRHGAERVAVAAGVLGGDQPVLAADAHAQRAAVGQQLRAASPRVAGQPRRELGLGEVADPPQQVVQRVGAAAALAAELVLDLLERVGVEQVAQLVGAGELAQQVAVERQRRDAPLRRGRVVLVEVLRDVLEVERRGERRGGLRLDRHELAAAVAQARQQLAQRTEVEVVGEQLAVGLEQDRERAVALGHGQQRLRAQPLLPERRALTGPAARDQQRARGALAEARAEQRRAAELADDEILDAVGVDRDELVRRQRVRVGQVQDDPVVRPQRVRLDAVLLAQQRAQRERPGRVHAGAEGREHAQPPVADLVAEALDDDRAVGRQDAGGQLLLAQVLDERARGALVAGVQARQALHGALVVERGELALEAADGAAELERATRLLALPERHLRGLAGRGGDDHAVARDLLDAPGGRAEQEDLALARLVHHLLVELADAAAAVRPGRRRRGRGRGSCRRSRSRCAARPRGRAAPPSCAPRRCAGAARRTRPTGSGRRAGRARSRAARA